MARAILALQLYNWPCQNGSNHSYTQVMQQAVSEWLEPFWHSSHVICMAVPEWFEPFRHSNHASGRARMARASINATGRARMARAILALKLCNWPCQKMARAILALKSCNLHGCARKARAILALKFGQWHYLRARMARAILALPTIFECHNGLSHSGTAIY